MNRTIEQHMTNASAVSTPSVFGSVGTDLGRFIADKLGEVETFLDVAVTQAKRLPNESSHHLLNAGGKRVRPILVFLAAQYGDPDRQEVVKAAAATEMIHLATLYHDDVMDDAPVRRGATAAHLVWTNSVAILTGDVLFARASQLSSELGPRAVLLQSETFERLVIGQLAEFAGPEEGADPVEHYITVLADKTGSLIAAAVEFGLLTSGAPEEYVAPMREYGEKVGVAFQLIDDVIDLTSTGETSGKTPGTDLREGVVTLPVLYVQDAADSGDAGAKRVVDLLEADLSSDQALEAARSALAAHPVTERVRQEAHRWAGEAIAALEVLPAGKVKDGLVDFARSVVDRAS
ncbi:polyprenyl synthetase family protein [Brevibacterium litoralis]|uniref:polyprenyl synthetase family protein n=1 Tax=Brevibacterium litoralis TaxID=3138935 RepID=UPI0032EC7131